MYLMVQFLFAFRFSRMLSCTFAFDNYATRFVKILFSSYSIPNYAISTNARVCYSISINIRLFSEL